MSAITIGLLLFGGMLALMALRVPIAISMFVPGALGYMAISSEAALLSHLKGMAFARFSVYDLSVIPLFLLMGAFATQGGLSQALFRAGAAFVGHFRGGMAMAGVLACAAFGSVCGSSVATAATMAKVALPEMERYNYSGRLSTAALAAGGTLGILIPPSVPLVIFAILAEQNIAKLFAAAFVPGFLAAGLYIASIALYCRRHPEAGPAVPRVAWGERLRALIHIWPIAVIFVIVFGGIYGGVFTPTEGAAVGAASTFIAALAKRELDLEGMKRCFYSTAETTGMIFMIFIGADMMNAALALSQMPNQLANAVSHLQLAPMLVMIGILLFYIVLGCVMDELSMIMLTIPVLFPVIMQLDFHGLPPDMKAIWFGILVLCVVEVGLIAPPVGLNVYVINSLARHVPMGETYRGVVPFLAADAVRVTILLAFPAVALTLVTLID